MKKLFLIFVILLTINNLRAQSLSEVSPVKWYSITEAEKLDSAEHRPFLIDVYTDWCGWCKRMMATTFANKQLAQYINANFYPVRLDAETKDTIEYQGKKWTSDGRTNTLARYLLKGQMSYPTIVYIDRDTNILPVPGYMTIKDIEPILVYFSEDVSRSGSLEDFRVDYMYAYNSIFSDELKKLPENQQLDTLGKIDWLTFDEAMEKQKETPKPMILDVWMDFAPMGTKMVLSANILERNVLKDSKIADYINKNYYPVKFYAATKDTIELGGRKFPGSQNGGPHSLTSYLTGGDFSFPTMFYFDKTGRLISKTTSYFGHKFYLTVLKFYAEEAYTKESFQDFYTRIEK